mmetsp:Transcript_10879/g.30554  ORF Transcript_10879/g.30554 Transcript_10879/m.30554 type:complete len:261 (-) Transcript_10879:129-911(-)
MAAALAWAAAWACMNWKLCWAAWAAATACWAACVSTGAASGAPMASAVASAAPAPSPATPPPPTAPPVLGTSPLASIWAIWVWAWIRRRWNSSFCVLRVALAREKKMTERWSSSIMTFLRRRDSRAALRFCSSRVSRSLGMSPRSMGRRSSSRPWAAREAGRDGMPRVAAKPAALAGMDRAWAAAMPSSMASLSGMRVVAVLLRLPLGRPRGFLAGASPPSFLEAAERLRAGSSTGSSLDLLFLDLGMIVEMVWCDIDAW